MHGTSLAGRSILIVEDEPVIALDLVTAFKQAVVLAARSLAEASGLVEHDDLSAAVVDFGLGDNDAGALCVRLEQRRIPFILHSGYSHHGPACRSGIVVPKPASPCHADPNRRRDVALARRGKTPCQEFVPPTAMYRLRP
jgi:CheY-like chemotaxis protein